MAAIAMANLNLSSDIAASLLSTLVSNGATAALLAADPQRLDPCLLTSHGEEGRDDETCSTSSDTPTSAVRQPAQQEATRAATSTAVAVTALAEACRAWADTVEAIESTPRRRRDVGGRADHERGVVHRIPAKGADSADTEEERFHMASPMGVCRSSDNDSLLTALLAATGPNFCGRNRSRAVTAARYDECSHVSFYFFERSSPILSDHTVYLNLSSRLLYT